MVFEDNNAKLLYIQDVLRLKSIRGKPTIFISFKSLHGHTFCDRFSIKLESKMFRYYK